MADYNIQMEYFNGSSYDNLYPVTNITGEYLPLSGGTMSGNITLAGQSIYGYSNQYITFRDNSTLIRADDVSITGDEINIQGDTVTINGVSYNPMNWVLSSSGSFGPNSSNAYLTLPKNLEEYKVISILIIDATFATPTNNIVFGGLIGDDISEVKAFITMTGKAGEVMEGGIVRIINSSYGVYAYWNAYIGNETVRSNFANLGTSFLKGMGNKLRYWSTTGSISYSRMLVTLI